MWFVGIVGNRSAGKSAIIGNVCGLPIKKPRDLQKATHVGTGLCLYALSSSPQETGMTIEDVKAHFTSVARDRSALGFVMALQPNDPLKLASMEDIFRMAKSKGFDLAAFVITRPYKNRPHARWSEPPEAIRRLKQEGIRVRVLDARRVPPHVNAKAVREALHWK